LLAEGGSLVRFITTVLFIGMMAGFGIFSFWKARRFRQP
jgi:MFS superfamily sulfate permease-like transporter